ncbi:hypothetical protein V866_004040 [Kwoniella sp. B9012]
MSSTDNQQYYRLASYSSQSTPVEGTATGETTQGGANTNESNPPGGRCNTLLECVLDCATGGHNHGERYGPA